ncbi:MAG TPA: hypothetical protein PKC39_14550 [Ferruginibacter sp.]|nr:hypothetical protein [Ferruginibacter sp.]HMP22176.1 hypothetical protein [Ferruginibacter sp.]
MNKLTRAQLQPTAERLMKAHKKDVIYSTADGNHFFEQHNAANHNALLKAKDEAANYQVETFTLTDTQAEVPTEVNTAEVLQAKIAAAEEELTGFKEALEASNNANQKKSLQKKIDKTTAELEQLTQALAGL